MGLLGVCLAVQVVHLAKFAVLYGLWHQAAEVVDVSEGEALLGGGEGTLGESEATLRRQTEATRARGHKSRRATGLFEEDGLFQRRARVTRLVRLRLVEDEASGLQLHLRDNDVGSCDDRKLRLVYCCLRFTCTVSRLGHLLRTSSKRFKPLVSWRTGLRLQRAELLHLRPVEWLW